jgi:signal transduction histidine kinase/CheY-like chemotaxis protein
MPQGVALTVDDDLVAVAADDDDPSGQQARRPAISREWVASLFSFLPTTMVGNLAGVVVLSTLFWGKVELPVFAAWLSAYLLLTGTRCTMLYRFPRSDLDDTAVLRMWLRWWNGATLYAGAYWGASAWIFYGHGGVPEQVGLLVVIYSFCVGAIPVLSPQSRVYHGFVLLCFVPTVVRVCWPPTLDGIVLATVLAVIFGITAFLARDYRMAVENLVRMKTRADRLAVQLRTEKSAAEAARHEAEVANRAKTQFFAAASHDLRQPLHAMGLFAEALRQRSHDEQAIQLVTSINGAVDALEGLFCELLDIARIDTGGVRTAPEHFNAGELFRRLRLHFEPSAFEKGLALRFRGGSHNAFADPLLVERILRNLVSNAIRYTDDGGVLVSCRKRRGELWFQVWDSGVGIGEAERERVFEEFYQVPRRDSVPPQRKGLGLGLAIVKRLAALIDVPLSLQSVPGRGTVFTFRLALGQVPRPVAGEVADPMPAGALLDGKCIVVVEDDATVRSALEVVLRSWGARVQVFDSLTEVAAVGNHRFSPDLLIVDYRLEEGSTGIEALAALRAKHGPVPAIVVTGSSTTLKLEAEAQAHDFHLLLKPVVPTRLRAIIGFKLGMRAPA